MSLINMVGEFFSDLVDDISSNLKNNKIKRNLRRSVCSNFRTINFTKNVDSPTTKFIFDNEFNNTEGEFIYDAVIVVDVLDVPENLILTPRDIIKSIKITLCKNKVLELTGIQTEIMLHLLGLSMMKIDDNYFIPLPYELMHHNNMFPLWFFKSRGFDIDVELAIPGRVQLQYETKNVIMPNNNKLKKYKELKHKYRRYTLLCNQLQNLCTQPMENHSEPYSVKLSFTAPIQTLLIYFTDINGDLVVDKSIENLLLQIDGINIVEPINSASLVYQTKKIIDMDGVYAITFTCGDNTEPFFDVLTFTDDTNAELRFKSEYRKDITVHVIGLSVKRYMFRNECFSIL